MEGGIVTEEYSRFYRMVFDFHKKYAPCPVDAEAWEAFCEDVVAVSNQGGNHPFLIAMLGAVHEELERRYQQT